MSETASDAKAYGTTTRKLGTVDLPDGKKLSLASLGMGDYESVRVEALKVWKESVIETWTDNVKHIPGLTLQQQQDEVRAKLRELESVTIEDVPKRQMQMPLTLPNGQYRMKNGKVVLAPQEVDFSVYWMSHTPAGRLFVAWLSVKRVPGQEHMTIDDVDQMFADDNQHRREQLLQKAVDRVGELTDSKLAKLDEAPEDPEDSESKKKRKDKRRRRRK